MPGLGPLCLWPGALLLDPLGALPLDPCLCMFTMGRRTYPTLMLDPHFSLPFMAPVYMISCCECQIFWYSVAASSHFVSHCFRVERGVEAQVQETTFDVGQWHQPWQHHRLLVPGSCHRRTRYERTGGHKQSTEAVRKAVSATSQVREPAGFRPTVRCHQGGTTTPVANWSYWQFNWPVSDRTSTATGHHQDNRWKRWQKVL